MERGRGQRGGRGGPGQQPGSTPGRGRGGWRGRGRGGTAASGAGATGEERSAADAAAVGGGARGAPRGTWTPRGGRGGGNRGRGGARTDFGSVQLDYNSLTPAALGIVDPVAREQSARRAYVPPALRNQQPVETPSTSGYTTPHSGLGAVRQPRGPPPAASPFGGDGGYAASFRPQAHPLVQSFTRGGGGGFNNNPRGSSSPRGRGSRGRGAGLGASSGGYGYNNQNAAPSSFAGPVLGMPGYGAGGRRGDPRLLIPIKFVKAKEVLPPSEVLEKMHDEEVAAAAKKAEEEAARLEEEREVQAMLVQKQEETVVAVEELPAGGELVTEVKTTTEEVVMANASPEVELAPPTKSKLPAPPPPPTAAERESFLSDSELFAVDTVGAAPDSELFVIDTVGMSAAPVQATAQYTQHKALGVPSKKEKALAKQTAFDKLAASDENEEVVYPAGRAIATEDPIAFTSAEPTAEAATSAARSTEVEDEDVEDEPADLSTLSLASHGKGKKASKNAKKQQARASKRARKAGVAHARSGNRHLLPRAGEEIDSDELSSDEGDLPGVIEEVRQGDSDLEWGDEGPPAPRLPKLSKQERKQQRDLQKDADKLDRISRTQAEEVERNLRNIRRRQGDKEAADDYAANLAAQSDSDDAVEGDNSAAAFVKGVEGLTLGTALEQAQQLADDQMSVSEDEDGSGWETSDQDSEDEVEMAVQVALGEADAAIERVFEDVSSDDDELSSDESSEEGDFEAELLSGKPVRFSSMGVAGPGGRRDRAERNRRRKGKGRADEDDEDSNSSDEDEDDSSDEDDYELDETWADQDEDFIRRLRKGEFGQLVLDDVDGDFDFEDDALMSSRVDRKARAKGPSPEGVFGDELQAQWAKDRAKKGEFKRLRMEARKKEQAALDAAKKAKRAQSAKAKRKSGTQTWSISDESEEESEEALESINRKMHTFANTWPPKETSMGLPPLGKKARVAVHLLAQVYGLKSQSEGKGANRFPVLYRTPKTGKLPVDANRIEAILQTARGQETYGRRRPHFGSGKEVGLWHALRGLSGATGNDRSGGKSARNKEGEVVGQGADKIKEDNIGFKLLARMGWTEGQQIGLQTGGILDPITARMKSGKTGLGAGYSLTRVEAHAFVNPPSR